MKIKNCVSHVIFVALFYHITYLGKHLYQLQLLSFIIIDSQSYSCKVSPSPLLTLCIYIFIHLYIPQLRFVNCFYSFNE